MSVLEEVAAERRRQDDTWGEQNHPNGTGERVWGDMEQQQKQVNQVMVEINQLTWMDILLEEVVEAFATDDERQLRAELVQVAAVATAWIECIDRRAS